MSTNHRERIERIVEKALDDARKEAGLLEKPGYYVNDPSLWPIVTPEGEITDQVAPAWVVVVTIKSVGIGEPDIVDGAHVFGMLPEDKNFVEAAKGLLGRVLQKRSEAEGQARLAAAAAEWAKANPDKVPS